MEIGFTHLVIFLNFLLVECKLILQSDPVAADGKGIDSNDPIVPIQAVIHNPSLTHCSRYAIIHDGGFEPHELDRIVRSVPVEGNQKSVIVSNIQEHVIMKDQYMGDHPIAVYNLEHNLWQDMYMTVAKVAHQCEVVFVLHANKGYNILDRFRLKMFSMKFLNDRRVRSNFAFWSRSLTKEAIFKHPEIKLFRFKIVLSVSYTQRLWSADYLCFSCGDRGKSQVVTLDLFKINRGWSMKANIFPYPLINYNGKVYRQRGISVPLYCLVKKVKGKWAPAAGNWFKLHKECYRKLNGSFVLSSPTNDQGVRLENGSFSGCLGELFKGKQDIQTGNMIFYEQNAYFDFTIFILTVPLVMIVPETKPVRDWITVFRPFSAILWICLISAILFASLFVRFQAYVVAHSDMYADQRHVAAYLIEHGTKIPAKSVMWEGVKIRRAAAGFKPFITAWFFFALMVIILYNGKLMATLIHPPMDPAIETLVELHHAVKHRGFKLGFASLGTAASKLFTDAKSGMFKDMNDKMVVSADGTTCLRRTQKEKFVCVGLEAAYMIFGISMFTDKYGRFTIYRAMEKFYEHYGAFVFNKADPIVPKYDWIIRQSLESGIMEHWFQREIREELKKVRKRRKDDVDVDDSNQPKPIQLKEHLIGLFILTGIMMVLGITSFLLEIFTFYVDRAFQRVQMNIKTANVDSTDVEIFVKSASLASLRIPFLK